MSELYLHPDGDSLLVTADGQLTADAACCCGQPIIAISTLDSSVSYTHLCNFETASGGVPGTPDCTNPPTDPDGACVKTPLQIDRDKYNADRALLAASLATHGVSWPLAAGQIVGRYKCWAGVTRAVYAEGEPLPSDSYGQMELRLSGTSATARLTLSDLQNLFADLYEKHFGAGTGNSEAAVLLLDVDNSGSITVSQWPASVRTGFLAWVAANYPNVRVREFTINNYLVDGEDWIRRLNDHYLSTVGGA